MGKEGERSRLTGRLSSFDMEKESESRGEEKERVRRSSSPVGRKSEKLRGTDSADDEVKERYPTWIPSERGGEEVRSRSSKQTSEDKVGSSLT